MNGPGVPDKQQPEGVRVPHWVTPLYLTLLFLLLHVALPWGLSLLSTRYGWENGCPGSWNLLALVLVIAGIASTLWLIVQHYHASPITFLEMRPGEKLVTPGFYTYSRNPMYLSELAFWLGWVLFYGSLTVLAGLLAWFLFFNFYAVPYEERDLETRFGDTYCQYKQMVPRWLGLPRH